MPSNISSIESHPNKKDIVSNLLAGIPYRIISARYNVAPMVLSRYKRKSIEPVLKRGQVNASPPAIENPLSIGHQRAVDTRAVIAQSSTALLVERRMNDYQRVLDKAERGGALDTWFSGAKTELQALRLRAELAGELQIQPASQVQVMVLMPPERNPSPDMGPGQVIDAEPVE